VKRNAPRPLSDALERLSKKLAPASTLAQVQSVWEQAAGATIAAVATPTAERNGTLTVTCSSSVWAQELDLMGAELLMRLNGALGGEERLKELRCRTG
jgi:predicted nucleic acid-binding Zn ribbon protein